MFDVLSDCYPVITINIVKRISCRVDAMALNLVPKAFSRHTVKKQMVNVLTRMVTKLTFGINVDASVMEVVIGGKPTMEHGPKKNPDLIWDLGFPDILKPRADR